MNRFLTTAVLAAAASLFAGRANAASLIYGFGDATDTTPGSTAEVANTGNGDNGSFHIATNGGKASVYLVKSDFSQLGTLGDLSAITYDYIVNTNGTSNTKSAPAIRFFTNSGFTEGLVYENVYQPSATTDTGVWHDNVSILGGELWQRANGHNFDQIINMTDKATFQGGFTPTDGAFTGDTYNASTPIYGALISFGSGIPGAFDANIDDVNLVFGGANPVTFTANPVPEPTTLAALAGAGVLGLRRRRRA